MSEQNLPHGLWPSPITPKMLSQGLRLNDAAWDSDGQTLVWLEGRSDRGVLVASTLNGDAPRDLTDELSVRARVGYGGGDFCAGSGRVVFASGGRLYSQSIAAGQRPKAVTPPFGQPASPTLSSDGKWILYVFSSEREDCLAVVDAEGKLWPKKVVEGHDFFMQPRLSADMKWAAWVAWDHPNMPWDGSQVYLARVVTHGSPIFKDVKELSPKGTTATLQPEFSPDGKYLSYLSDENGWFNFHLYDLESGASRCISREDKAQLGGPAWAQGLRLYGWSHDSHSIIFIRNERGLASLWSLDVASGSAAQLKVLGDYTDIQQPSINPRRAAVAAVVSSSTRPARVVVQSLEDGNPIIAKRATSESVSPGALCAAQPVQWKTTGGADAHGLLYRPANSGAKSQEKPPAIITIHGGPTSQARAAFSGEIQFYTTRGYTVLSVNYRGSTGYGRAYMDALRGNWGIHDVDDAVSGATFLVEQNHADASRLVIMGGSAGGFTVLQSLVRHPGFFKAGVCLFGVSNMFTLAADTHKFEERYLDSMLGPLPEASALYRERSPIFHASKIVDPVAVFQGEIDEVVPRAQSDSIVENLKRRGVPHEYHVYPGEGHGWRKAETIEAYYTSVEKFLKTYVIFA